MSVTALKINTEDRDSFAKPAVADALVAKARELKPFFQAEAPKGEKLRAPTPEAD